MASYETNPIEIEFAETLPTGKISSALVEDSFDIEKSTICSVKSVIHLGDNSITPICAPLTAPVVSFKDVIDIGADIVEGSVVTHDVPL